MILEVQEFVLDLMKISHMAMNEYVSDCSPFPIAFAGAPPPLKLDRKIRVGSKPEPPVLDTVPASKVGAIYLSEKKKVFTEKNEHVPSEPISGHKHDPVVKVVVTVLSHVIMPRNL